MKINKQFKNKLDTLFDSVVKTNRFLYITSENTIPDNGILALCDAEDDPQAAFELAMEYWWWKFDDYLAREVRDKNKQKHIENVKNYIAELEEDLKRTREYSLNIDKAPFTLDPDTIEACVNTTFIGGEGYEACEKCFEQYCVTHNAIDLFIKDTNGNERHICPNCIPLKSLIKLAKELLEQPRNHQTDTLMRYVIVRHQFLRAVGNPSFPQVTELFKLAFAKFHDIFNIEKELAENKFPQYPWSWFCQFYPRAKQIYTKLLPYV